MSIRGSNSQLAAWAGGFLLACAAASSGAVDITLTPGGATGLTVAPGNNTTWTVFNDIGNGPRACSAPAPGFGFEDAGFPSPNDAYDGGWLISVNGVRFADPDGIVDLTGNVLTAGPAAMSGLNVSVQHYFSATDQLVRVMVFLQNPTGAPISAAVNATTNFGSDATSVVNATSSGDALVSLADRWLVTSDGGPTDEVNTLVLYGPGLPAAVPVAYSEAAPFTCSGTQGLDTSFNVTVPANSTRSLMFFGGIGGVTVADNTVASAQASAALFDSNATLPADWLTGLNATQQSQILNWAFAPPPPPQSACVTEGFTGAKLTLCRQVCDVPQSPSRLSALIRIWMAAYRSEPPCAR